MKAKLTPTKKEENTMVYTIIRNYFHKSGHGRIIARGLSLEQAQTWCHDPETSSSTCKSKVGKARTRRIGAWFDSYTDTR